MPLQIRPYQPHDEASLRERFSRDGKPPWMRLPHPFTLDHVLAPVPQLTVFVSEGRRGEAVGLLAIDEGGTRPQIVGPLLSDDQLSSLYGRALLEHGVGWARHNGIGQVQVKLDLGEDRALGFFIQQGFQVLEVRQYVLEAHQGKRPLTPAPAPEGYSIGPSPDMLSSDYMRLYQSIGAPLGWADRTQWPRPQVFEHLQKPGLHLFAAQHGDTYVGFAEMEERQPGEAELVYFGLLAEHRGVGLGGAFLERVLQSAWEVLKLQTVRVSTLSTDAPQALPNYLKRGFRKERAMVFLERNLAVPVPAQVGEPAP